jgi:hypothetical protein
MPSLKVDKRAVFAPQLLQTNSTKHHVLQQQDGLRYALCHSVVLGIVQHPA